MAVSEGQKSVLSSAQARHNDPQSQNGCRVIMTQLLRIVWPYGLYVVVALAVMLPLLRPGFILTLDMVFAPHLRLPLDVNNNYLFYAALHVLNFVLPGDVLQKLLLMGILLLSGVGAHQLAEYVLSKQARLPLLFGCWFAGVLYMINPFVYGRFMAGQFAVVLGYALLPWLVRSLLELIKKPGWGQALRVAAWVLAISVASIHVLGVALIIAAALGGFGLWRYRRQAGYALKLGQSGLLIAVAGVALSSYWLVPLLAGHGQTATTIDAFGAGDRSAFATFGGQVGPVLNVLALQGFWFERTDMVLLPQDFSSWWLLWTALLWVIVLLGVRPAWRADKSLTLVFTLLGLLAWALALGTNPLSQWLYAHVPLFAGYREPQKFVALLALSYAYFGAYGSVRMVEYMAKRIATLAAAGLGAGLLLVPIATAPLMLWGFSGQLSPWQYPADWYQVNDYFNADRSTYKVLFLPWHLYMSYDFAGRIVGDPAEKFFDKPIVGSDNPEIGQASPTVHDPLRSQLEQRVLPQAPGRADLGAQLRPLDIKYVLLDKDYDYQRYNYLDQQIDLGLITETKNLKLYRTIE